MGVLSFNIARGGGGTENLEVILARIVVSVVSAATLRGNQKLLTLPLCIFSRTLLINFFFAKFWNSQIVPNWPMSEQLLLLSPFCATCMPFCHWLVLSRAVLPLAVPL